MTSRRVSWLLVVAICLSFAAFNEAYSQQPQFGPPVKAEAGDRDEFVLSDQEPPRELASGAEIILVSGYEASDKVAFGTRVKVKLDRAGKQVLLVLTSYENIAWEVEASPGTIVKAILVSAYYRSTLRTRIQTAAFAVKLPYAYELENRDFAALLAQLNKWFGAEKVDAFRGKY